MAGFDHGPSQHQDEQTAEQSARNSRIGLVLFAFYLLLYGGFMFLNVFSPDVMEIETIGGVNLAITYGVGLIAAAFVVALLYSWLCRVKPTTAAKEAK